MRSLDLQMEIGKQVGGGHQCVGLALMKQDGFHHFLMSHRVRQRRVLDHDGADARRIDIGENVRLEVAVRDGFVSKAAPTNR